MNSFRISKFGLLSVIFFIFISFVARSLFPFADEPDWSVTAQGVLFGDHAVWSPYFFLGNWFNLINIFSSDCNLNTNLLSFWVYVQDDCNENFTQIFIRWILTLIILLPLFLVIIFRVAFVKFMSFVGIKLTAFEWNRRIDALALSLILPGMLYYLGVLAEEQLHLIVSLFIFLFWGFWKIILLLLFILYNIDLGNTVVTIFFVFSFYLLTRLRYYGRRVFFLILAIFLIAVSFVGHNVLHVILNIGFLFDGILTKTAAILDSVDSNYFRDKYPLILRPVITFMSFIFMTPSGVKAPIAYIFFLLFLILILPKIIARKNVTIDAFLFAPLFCILFFVFLLPNYANAKYYMFTSPFFVYSLLFVYNKWKALLFVISLCAIVLSHLVLLRL